MPNERISAMANLRVMCTCGAIYEVIESKDPPKDQRPSKCVMCDREVFPPDTNIWKRFWAPLQMDCGMSAEILENNGPVLVPRYGFHALRHAAASLFIQYLKWSPKRLQAVMGHSSVRMTFDLYGHLFEDIEADRADMAKIEAAIRAA
jgi:hypothetical protein